MVVEVGTCLEMKLKDVKYKVSSTNWSAMLQTKWPPNVVETIASRCCLDNDNVEPLFLHYGMFHQRSREFIFPPVWNGYFIKIYLYLEVYNLEIYLYWYTPGSLVIFLSKQTTH